MYSYVDPTGLVHMVSSRLALNLQQYSCLCLPSTEITSVPYLLPYLALAHAFASFSHQPTLPQMSFLWVTNKLGQAEGP